MKNLAILFLIIFGLTGTTISTPAQTSAPKEVLIIGTMHQVPKVIKNSYKPLLKRAKAYQPQAIYVESPPAWDTLSLQNSRPKFLAKVDSLRQCTNLDRQQIARISCKSLSEMTPEDFKTMQRYHSLNLDAANSEYYQYLYNFGLAGSPKPTQEEDGDLTAKLAIHLGIKELRSMDNQWYRSEYHKAWAECSKADRADGEIEHLKKMIKSFTMPEILNALSGRYGRYTNSEKTTRKYHIINSFRYRQTTCEPCTAGMNYWDARNLEMARNIGDQIRANGQQRSVVIVGAGHIEGLREALAREYPDIRVAGRL